MDNFDQALIEFLQTIGLEGVELEEAASNSALKFRARVKAHKHGKLTPSKYLKKYGNRWHNLKEEELSEEKAENKNKKNEVANKKGREYLLKHPRSFNVTRQMAKDNDPRARDTHVRYGRELFQGVVREEGETPAPAATADASSPDTKLKNPKIWYKYLKGNKEASAVRRVDDEVQHTEELVESRGMTSKKAKKEERLATNRRNKDRFRDLQAKKDMKMNDKPHTAVDEEVKDAKGNKNKKDKRPATDTVDLPTAPSGMNAGMRMMPVGGL